MNNPILSNLDPNSSEFKEGVASQLNRIDPTKPAGPKLCDAIMRLWPTPAFEAMLFRHPQQGASEIYLRRRALDDTAYPGQWHAPGALFRHGEKPRDVANRLKGEFGVPIEKFELVGYEITNEERGTVHSLIYLIQLVGDARIDDRHAWFSTNNLPQAMVDLHRDRIIPVAAQVYWQRFVNARRDH